MLSQLAIDLFDIKKLNGNDFIGFNAARALHLGRSPTALPMMARAIGDDVEIMPLEISAS